MKIKGILEIVDDYSEKHYKVKSIKDGCYYFVETTVDNMPLRYNETEGRIEFLTGKNSWDVYSAYIYQVNFITY